MFTNGLKKLTRHRFEINVLSDFSFAVPCTCLLIGLIVASVGIRTLRLDL